MKLLLKKGPPYREIRSTSLPEGACVCVRVSGFVAAVKAVFRMSLNLEVSIYLKIF